MPPALILDLSKLDLNALAFDKEAILKHNPQRYEMQHLDGIIMCDKDQHLIVGFKDVTPNEFWVRGHIPGRPLMPGVIMIEAAAQLTSFYYKEIVGYKGFVGFAGVTDTSFRATVEPGTRLYLVAKGLKIRSRLFVCQVQGIANGNLVFDTTISGAPV
jgi:3-hydroxyacyl-[acyl-carrier-protein] dehydratase